MPLVTCPSNAPFAQTGLPNIPMALGPSRLQRDNLMQPSVASTPPQLLGHAFHSLPWGCGVRGPPEASRHLVTWDLQIQGFAIHRAICGHQGMGSSQSCCPFRSLGAQFESLGGDRKMVLQRFTAAAGLRAFPWTGFSSSSLLLDFPSPNPGTWRHVCDN